MRIYVMIQINSFINSKEVYLFLLFSSEKIFLQNLRGNCLKKKYILDTNVLIEDHLSIETLRNGVENEIYIPKTVIDELDGLKKNASKRPQVLRVLGELEKHKDYIQILDTLNYEDKPDNKILKEILTLQDNEKYIFVTNDRLFRLKAEKEGLNVEEYKASNPFLVDSEKYTGFVELYTKDGKNEDFSK
jgi:PhoH-like ATPase